MSAKEIAKKRAYWTEKCKGMDSPARDEILMLLDEVEKLKRYAGETT